MSTQYDKFVDSVSSTVYYHIHTTIEALSRDATQFQHKISEYAHNLTKKEDIKSQFDAIFETYINNHQGIDRKLEILDTFLSKNINKQMNSNEKAMLFGQILSKSVLKYLQYLAIKDGDCYFTTSRQLTRTLLGKLKSIIVTETVNIGFALTNKSGHVVPRNQYEVLLKKYKKVLAEKAKLEETLANSYHSSSRKEDEVEIETISQLLGSDC